MGAGSFVRMDTCAPPDKNLFLSMTDAYLASLAVVHCGGHFRDFHFGLTTRAAQASFLDRHLLLLDFPHFLAVRRNVGRGCDDLLLTHAAVGGRRRATTRGEDRDDERRDHLLEQV